MTRRTAFFFDELCLWHAAGPHALTLPVGGWVQPPAAAGHAESPETKRRLKSLLDVSGLTARLQLRSAPPASDEDLLRVHPAHYLERFKALSDAGGGSLGQDAPIGPGSYEIARLSAGLAIAALDAVLAGEVDNAYSLSRPPGHHCLPDQAMGFCFFANIAVAIEAAKARHGVERVAVLDWDVHHGNGTQAIYYRRDDVLSISCTRTAASRLATVAPKTSARIAVVASTSTCRCFPAAVTTPTCRPCNASCCQRWSASARN